MTPGLLSGVLTGLFFIAVVVVGISCLNALQTPTEYAKAYPPSQREY